MFIICNAPHEWPSALYLSWVNINVHVGGCVYYVYVHTHARTHTCAHSCMPHTALLGSMLQGIQMDQRCSLRTKDVSYLKYFIFNLRALHLYFSPILSIYPSIYLLWEFSWLSAGMIINNECFSDWCISVAHGSNETLNNKPNLQEIVFSTFVHFQISVSTSLCNRKRE